MMLTTQEWFAVGYNRGQKYFLRNRDILSSNYK